MFKQRKFLRFGLLTLAIYVILYGLYLFTSVGIPDKTIYLQLRRYIPCALAAAAAISLWYKNDLPLNKLFPHALVALLWLLVYPITYWLTYHLNTNFIDNHFDIAFGAYVFTATVCLRLVLLTNCKNFVQQKSDAFLVGLIHTLLLILPLAQLVYYLLYQTPFTENAAVDVLQTNPAEAREFILLNFGYTGVVSFLLFWLVILLVFYSLNKISLPENFFVGPRILALILVMLLSTGFYSHKIFYETGIMWVYYQAQQYFVGSQKFTANHKENFDQLTVVPPVKTFTRPSTIIMIIGESATRYYMSAYGYTEHDTTPWMRQMSQQPDFILFKHAYSTIQQTVGALERALTEKSQYNNLEFNQAITLLDLAKKAGYTTYWFSNQGFISTADTPISLVAKTADHSAWVEETLANTTEMKYDGELLQYLKKVDPTKNNFIVLHISGSHDNYINRYPPEFTKWGTPNVYEPILDYDNSLAYTDQFLKDVYTYGNEHLNLQAMLYFSDHGADPRSKRHPDNYGFIGLRIPLFLYLSSEYRQLYPETASALQSHANSYFTNDLVYELIAGILNIRSNHYDENNSLASSKYKFTRDTLKTKLGEWKLSEDMTEGEK